MSSIKVRKWDVPEIGEPFEVPGIRVIHFGPQESMFAFNLLRVWTECWSDVDPEEHIKRKLIVFETNTDFNEMFYIHRMSCIAGIYVWHLYEEVQP